MKKVIVKEWIIKKNLSNNQAFAVLEEGGVGSVERETEKAYLVKFYTDYGTIVMWTPKSQTTEIKEEQKQEITLGLVIEYLNSNLITEKQAEILGGLIKCEVSDEMIEEKFREYTTAG